MKEPSLWIRSTKDRAVTAFRFLWLPTFDRPVSVRIEKPGDNVVVHAIELDGRGGYAPGTIVANKSAKLTGEQWGELKDRLEKIKFWSLPTEEEPDGLDTDGDQLILEGVMACEYHIVDRHSPKPGAGYTASCEFMLDLSGLDVKKTWKEYRD